MPPRRGRFIRFGLKIFLYSALGVFTSNYLLYHFAGRSISTSYHNAVNVLHLSRLDLIKYTLTANIAVFGAVVVGVITASVYMTHHISGPLYRIEKDAEEVGRGDFNVAFRLRDGDFLIRQAARLARGVGEWRSRFAEIKDLTGLMAAESEAMKTVRGSLEPEVHAERIIKLAKEIEERAAWFRVE